MKWRFANIAKTAETQAPEKMDSNRIESRDISPTLASVRSCSQCENLPLGPKPILQLHPQSKILIAGQAPGRITHEKGTPFDDPSGDRLREWLGIDRETFYDEKCIAILPMAFCYPGTGKGGDLAPPPVCAQTWRKPLLEQLCNVQLTIVIGKYALDWHIGDKQAKNLTETVKQWRNYGTGILPLPHPSPRNNRWLKNNPWFHQEVLPELKNRVASLLPG